MKFYNPFGFAVLALIPAVIILHLFKSKNRRYDVSSLYLWRKAEINLRESKTSKRLNEILRLIIQISAAAAAAFACARPYIPTDAGNYTLIADCSMSMENKCGEMKKRLSDFISGLDKSSQIVVISADENPKILVSGSDKRKVISEINKLQTGIKGIDYSKTKNIAAGTEGECWFFSDLNDNDIPESWNTVKIGENEDNVAVTYLNTDSESATARISNFSQKDINTVVSLYIDDKMYECREISIRAEESSNVVFKNIEKGNLIRCTVNDDEGIFSDNSMSVERLHKKVQLCCENIFIEKAAAAVENISIDKSEAFKEGYDIYIFDGSIPQKLPKGDIIYFNAKKDNGIVNMGEITKVNNITADDNSFFENADIEFCVEKALKIDDEDYHTILSSEETPLIISKTLDSGKCIISSFDLHDSDFVLYKEFPIFMQNCFDMFRKTGNIENPDTSESNLRTENFGNYNAGTIRKTSINRSIQAAFALMFVILVIFDALASKKGGK